MTWWQAFPALVVALALHAVVGGVAWVDAAFVAIALVGRERVSARRPLVLTVTTVIAAVVGLRVGYLSAPSSSGAGFVNGLSSLGSALAGSAAVVLTLRALLASPPGGRRVDLALGTGLVIACGAVDGGPRYVAGVTVFAVAALAAMHRETVAETPWKRLDRRTRRRIVGSALIAVTVTVASSIALVPIHHFLWRELMARSGAFGREPTTSSFAPDITLTTDTDLSLSEEPVLEVTGAYVDHLRGAVLSTYSQGRWGPAREELRERTIDGTRGDRATEVRAETPQVRLFVPLGAHSLATPGGRVRSDDTSVLFAEAGARADRVWFDGGDHCDCGGPTSQDTTLPRGSESAWRRLARTWVGGATTDSEKVRSISSRFAREFRYSLESHRTVGVDPIWDFLTTTPTGHCEYFASGMALLLRASGVPARVVTGYRVAEYDPLNERYVVRQKHAHAWVEYWDGSQGWQTADPTPPAALGALYPARTPWLKRASRWIRTQIAVRYVTRARLATIALGFVTIALIALSARWAIRRSPRRRAQVLSSRSQTAFHDLAATLLAAGVQRPDHEPLESFAARLRDQALLGEASDGAADVIERYAAFRYGSAGDADDVERALRSAAQTIADRLKKQTIR